MTIQQVATSEVEYQSSWLAQTWGLIRWNLFMTWRRLMSKILLIILVLGYALIIGTEYLAYRVGNPQIASAVSAALTFPSTIGTAQSYLSFMGPILLCVLAGAVIGGEYGYGTQRQQLGRGLSRTQVLAAQIIAMALIALLTAVLMLVLASLVGVTLGPATGTPLKALTISQWEGVALYYLAVALRLFIYMLIAVFMATLGKSVVAGIAFSLGIILIEGVLSTTLGVLAFNFRGQIGDMLSNIPKWLPGSGGTTLITAAEQKIFLANPQISTAPVDIWQGISVVLIYALVLIMGSYLLYTSRDLAE